MALADAYRRQGGRMPHAPARQKGNWKLAYADFLTALVALFLVLWLVNDAPDHDRTGLAGYFRGDEVAFVRRDSPNTNTLLIADRLRENSALQPYGESLQITALESQVRIELMDGFDHPMFETGSYELTSNGEAAIRELSGLLLSAQWPVSIEGHTDAFPATGDSGDNWTLSLGRADEARRLLIAAGLPPNRIAGIVGYADTRPLRAEEPHRAANRRVTLILQLTE